MREHLLRWGGIAGACDSLCPVPISHAASGCGATWVQYVLHVDFVAQHLRLAIAAVSLAALFRVQTPPSFDQARELLELPPARYCFDSRHRQVCKWKERVPSKKALSCCIARKARENRVSLVGCAILLVPPSLYDWSSQDAKHVVDRAVAVKIKALGRWLLVSTYCTQLLQRGCLLMWGVPRASPSEPDMAVGSQHALSTPLPPLCPPDERACSQRARLPNQEGERKRVRWKQPPWCGPKAWPGLLKLFVIGPAPAISNHSGVLPRTNALL